MINFPSTPERFIPPQIEGISTSTVVTTPSLDKEVVQPQQQPAEKLSQSDNYSEEVRKEILKASLLLKTERVEISEEEGQLKLQSWILFELNSLCKGITQQDSNPLLFIEVLQKSCLEKVKYSDILRLINYLQAANQLNDQISPLVKGYKRRLVFLKMLDSFQRIQEKPLSVFGLPKRETKIVPFFLILNEYKIIFNKLLENQENIQKKLNILLKEICEEYNLDPQVVKNKVLSKKTDLHASGKHYLQSVMNFREKIKSNFLSFKNIVEEINKLQVSHSETSIICTLEIAFEKMMSSNDLLKQCLEEEYDAMFRVSQGRCKESNSKEELKKEQINPQFIIETPEKFFPLNPEIIHNLFLSPQNLLIEFEDARFATLDVGSKLDAIQRQVGNEYNFRKQGLSVFDLFIKQGKACLTVAVEKEQDELQWDWLEEPTKKKRKKRSSLKTSDLEEEQPDFSDKKEETPKVTKVEPLQPRNPFLIKVEGSIESTLSTTSIVRTSLGIWNQYIHEIDFALRKSIRVWPEKATPSPTNRDNFQKNLEEALMNATDHNFLAGCGIETFIRALTKGKAPRLAAIYPMMMQDWYMQAEQLLGIEFIKRKGELSTEHSLVDRAKESGIWENLPKELREFLFDFDRGSFWYRFPISSIHRDKSLYEQPFPEGLKWLETSLQYLDVNKEPSKEQLVDFAKFVLKSQHLSTRLFLHLIAKVVPHAQQIQDIVDLYKPGGILEKRILSLIDSMPKVELGKEMQDEERGLLLERVDRVCAPYFGPKVRNSVLAIGLQDLKIGLLRFQELQKACENSETVPDHLVPMYARNLLNIQWLFDKAYKVQGFMRNGIILRTHDFAVLQENLPRGRARKRDDQKILNFNFGNDLHYTRCSEKDRMKAMIKSIDMGKAVSRANRGHLRRAKDAKEINFLDLVKGDLKEAAEQAERHIEDILDQIESVPVEDRRAFFFPKRT